jgi:dihydrolipoamide dehydrogenase
MIYDLVVIGGGPAGYIGAERAGHAGLKTLLIEKNHLGGVCLNEGCIPTKTLLYSAKLYDGIKNGGKYGVSADNIVLKHQDVVARKNKVVKKLVAGVSAQLAANKVEVVMAEAQILDKNHEGYRIKGGDQIFTAPNLLIASGSKVLIPPIKGVKEGIGKGTVLTSKEALELASVPKELVIVGAGVIGLEMASYFNSAGSKVTVIESLDHVGGNLDREIGVILQKSYEKKGVAFKLNAKVFEVRDGEVHFETSDGVTKCPFEKLLMCIGRRPNVDGLGLERIGVEVVNGRIKVDERGKTNIPNVYAAGDVNGFSMLAHTAYREAEVCINTMLGRRDIMRYNAVPAIIYTNPEVASVGETEASAKERNISFDVSKISMLYSGRYLAENETGDGICKVLIEKGSRRIIGVHMIGNYASEIIHGAGIMIETEMRADDIKELVFPHPTVSEIIREAAFNYKQ